MKELLEYLLKKIVKNPDAIVIEETEENGVVIFNVTVDPTETGWVIGKGGRTIKSLRSILRVVAIKEGKRVDIKLAGDDEHSPTNPLS
jgi:uncharacterized protein